jgi:hypothetical protein
MPGSTRREAGAEREGEPQKFVSTRQHESESQTEWFAIRRAPPQQPRSDEAVASPPVDEDTKELEQKVGSLVGKRFGGDYKRAFEHYDADGDGAIDKSDLVRLLSEAGVGNSLTRGTWASRIIERLDTSGDHKVQWDEFDKVFRENA